MLEKMFIYSWRMGVKDFELGAKFKLKAPILPLKLEEVETMVNGYKIQIN